MIKPKIIQSPLLNLFPAGKKLKKNSKNEEIKKENKNVHLKEEEMFVSTKRIVDELGGFGLKGLKKREWENKMRLKQGALPLPNQKIPYPILQGMIKKRKKREEKLRKEAIEQGVTPPKKKLTTTQLMNKKEKLEKKKRADEEKQQFGSFKKGILFIPRNVINHEKNGEKVAKKTKKVKLKNDLHSKKKMKKWK